MPELLSAKSLDCWVHNAVNGSEIDTLGLPFNSGTFFSSGLNVPVVMGECSQNDDLPTSLSRPSSRHCRSSVYNPSPDQAQSLEPGLVWGDRYGHRYTSLSLKGNYPADIEVEYSPTCPYGFRVRGLVESSEIARTVAASNTLRASGVQTDWIVGVLEPKTLPYEGKMISTQELRRRLIHRLTQEGLNDPSTSQQVSTEKIQQIIGRLSAHNSTFYILVRASDVSDRWGDFSTDTFDQALERMRRVIKAEQLISQRDRPLFDVDDINDRTDYMTNYVPRANARNLAAAHGAGFYLGFRHALNVSALGAQPDGDSTRGKPLGLGDDVVTAGMAIDDILTIASAGHVTPILRAEQTGLIQRTRANRPLWSRYYDNFLIEYFRLQRFTPNHLEHAMFMIRTITSADGLAAVGSPLRAVVGAALRLHWPEYEQLTVDAYVSEVRTPIMTAITPTIDGLWQQYRSSCRLPTRRKFAKHLVESGGIKELHIEVVKLLARGITKPHELGIDFPGKDPFMLAGWGFINHRKIGSLLCGELPDYLSKKM